MVTEGGEFTQEQIEKGRMATEYYNDLPLDSPIPLPKPIISMNSGKPFTGNKESVLTDSPSTSNDSKQD